MACAPGPTARLESRAIRSTSASWSAHGRQPRRCPHCHSGGGIAASRRPTSSDCLVIRSTCPWCSLHAPSGPGSRRRCTHGLEGLRQPAPGARGLIGRTVAQSSRHTLRRATAPSLLAATRGRAKGGQDPQTPSRGTAWIPVQVARQTRRSTVFWDARSSVSIWSSCAFASSSAELQPSHEQPGSHQDDEGEQSEVLPEGNGPVDASRFTGHRESPGSGRVVPGGRH